MFNRIELTNFKAYAQVNVPMRRLTVLVGPNNAGKSTILHSLLILVQTLDNPGTESIITSGREVDVGSGRDLLHTAAATTPFFEIGIGIDRYYANSVVGDHVSMRYVLPEDPQAPPRLVRSVIEQKGRTLSGITRNGTDDWTPVGVSKAIAKRLDVSNIGFLPALHPKQPSRTPAQAVSSQAFEAFFQWRMMSRQVWHTLPVRRDIPHFAQTGKTFDYPPESGGEAFLISLRPTPGEPRILHMLNEWIAKHPFMIDHLDLRSIDDQGRILALYARERGCDGTVNVANMGRGVSQSLPVIARILRTTDGECGLIEQPELHLHPGAQAELADAIVEKITATKRSQLVIETHSEHLLSRIRRHVARGTLKTSDVIILSVTRDCDKSSVAPLELDQDGNFIKWPPNFFQHGYNEALAIAQAAETRRSEERSRTTNRKRRAAAKV